MFSHGRIDSEALSHHRCVSWEHRECGTGREEPEQGGFASPGLVLGQENMEPLMDGIWEAKGPDVASVTVPVWELGLQGAVGMSLELCHSPWAHSCHTTGTPR